MSDFNYVNQLAIALSFITSLFFLKIFFGNIRAAGATRKWSPEDKIAFKIDPEYAPIDKKDDEDDGGVQESAQQSETFTKRDRWANICSNDHENIPYALFIFWGCFAIGDDMCCPIVFYTSILYTIFRFLHTIFYANGINPKGVPLRSLMFGLGQLSVVVSAIVLPIGAIRKYF